MGAAGVRHVILELQDLGFQPIELERYSTSNKIWATKIKRLRLPDVLCAKTGLRVEVRAKSRLEIRMSHAPNNPDRFWDAGLRDDDVVALIVCQDSQGQVGARGRASYFTVAALREAAAAGRVSRMKAASEGSEQDIAWPAIISSRPGRVVDVTDARIFVEWGGDGGPARRYGYALNGKLPYVRPGEKFSAATQFLAGSPGRLADLRAHLSRRYDPIPALSAGDAGERYAAVKAISVRNDAHARARPLLERLLKLGGDPRLMLEIANTASGLGLVAGMEYLRSAIWKHPDAAMQMEAVLIVTELGRSGRHQTFARGTLAAIAADVSQFGNEIRQAAIWGLGHNGLRSFDLLLPFLADQEENVALHAIAAFDADTPASVLRELVASLVTTEPASAYAIMEVLKLIGTAAVVRELVSGLPRSGHRRPWFLAALGKLPAPLIREHVKEASLVQELEPMLLSTTPENWLGQENTVTSLNFLLKQNF
jgi:hypothetical protein